MPKYFLDTEFVDTGTIIDLISIGIVCEDGREYYAQSISFDVTKVSQWLIDNVLSHLSRCPLLNEVENYYNLSTELVFHRGQYGKCSFSRDSYIRKAIESGHCNDCEWCTPNDIAREVMAFLDPAKFGTPELHGWCSGYDWVVFCQLFGLMVNLPEGYPHYIKDLQHLLDERGISDDQLPAQEEGLHNALADARHIKKLWGYITRNDAEQ